MFNDVNISSDAPRAIGAIDPLSWAPFGRLDLGSLAVDRCSQAALIDDVLYHALYGDTTRQVVTANAQFYVLAKKSRRFRECLRTAEYVCADGMPIVWACTALYGSHVSRIAGVNLIERLCHRGAAYRLRVFLLGGKPGASKLTAAMLKERYPGVQISGVDSPSYGFERNEESLRKVLDQIAESKPHVVFVGLGAPKQEFFIRDHIRRLNVPLAIGVGGSFEILSGQLKRAPVWMQSSGLEWAYRLAQEPTRLWKRYLVGNAEFLWYIVKARVTRTSRKEDEVEFGFLSRLELHGDSR